MKAVGLAVCRWRVRPAAGLWANLATARHCGDCVLRLHLSSLSRLLPALSSKRPVRCPWLLTPPEHQADTTSAPGLLKYAMDPQQASTESQRTQAEGGSTTPHSCCQAPAHPPRHPKICPLHLQEEEGKRRLSCQHCYGTARISPSPSPGRLRLRSSASPCPDVPASDTAAAAHGLLTGQDVTVLTRAGQGEGIASRDCRGKAWVAGRRNGVCWVAGHRHGQETNFVQVHNGWVGGWRRWYVHLALPHCTRPPYPIPPEPARPFTPPAHPSTHQPPQAVACRTSGGAHLPDHSPKRPPARDPTHHLPTRPPPLCCLTRLRIMSMPWHG